MVDEVFMPPPLGDRGMKCYLCPSVRPSLKIFVKYFLASVQDNDLIFGLKLYHDVLYRVSPFQVSLFYFLFAGMLIDIFMSQKWTFFVTDFSAFVQDNEWFDIWFKSLPNARYFF